MNTPNNTAPDFGEPWKTTNYRNGGILTSYDQPIMEGFKLVKRAVTCVNACAGMRDPAAEIQALRDAVKEAYRVIENARFVHQAITTYAPQDAVDKIENQKHCDNMSSALAKLKTLA